MTWIAILRFLFLASLQMITNRWDWLSTPTGLVTLHQGRTAGWISTTQGKVTIAGLNGKWSKKTRSCETKPGKKGMRQLGTWSPLSRRGTRDMMHTRNGWRKRRRRTKRKLKTFKRSNVKSVRNLLRPPIKTALE